MVWGVELAFGSAQQQTRHSRQLQPPPSKLEHWHQRLHQESHCTLVCIAGRLIVVWIGNESRNNAFECNQLEDRLRDQGCCGMLRGSCWGVFLFLFYERKLCFVTIVNHHNSGLPHRTFSSVSDFVVQFLLPVRPTPKRVNGSISR